MSEDARDEAFDFFALLDDLRLQESAHWAFIQAMRAARARARAAAADDESSE
jgi:hypothetical protein